MKSWGDAETTQGHRPRPRRRAPWPLLAAAAVTALIFYQFPLLKMTLMQRCSRLGELRNVYNPQWESFNWDAIHASEQLEFHSCYWDNFQCAKLKLPLDWFNSTHPNSTVSIAIAKLPAQVPVDDPRYAGPILVNPGGPGGSGVAMALMRGENLQSIFGPSSTATGLESEAKYYDILGFDPRGIGFTKPLAYCMPDNPSSWSWHLRQSTEGILGSSDAALGRLWSMTHAFGASCKQHSGADGKPDIKQYMSTSSVARDMLEIAEKHAEWAADEAKRLAIANKPKSTTKVADLEANWNPRSYERGSVKLTYAGFSYGTYLGATFAAMFPDRVGRLMLDGVVNVHDYNNDLAQGSLHDTEKDMKSFYTFCFVSGPELCPLATTASGAGDIEERTQLIIMSLYHNPIAISTEDGPEIFTYSDLKGIIFSALYQPALVFPVLGHLLLAIETRDSSVMETIAKGVRPSHVYTCPARNSTTTLPLTYDVAQDAILCGDGAPHNDLTLAEMEAYYHLLAGISPSAAGIWALLKMKCAAWRIKPLHRFGDDANFHAITAHPILWVSNTADPVTPLRSARAMAARYPGSALLVQDSAGHCSVSMPTPCTIAKVKRYFQTGGVPVVGTVCVPPASPWSLNSTDPRSPFYDPSLGQPAEEVVVSGVGEVEMEAARGLQGWVGREVGVGRGVLGRRVEGMVGALRGVGGGGEARGRDEL